MLLVPSTDGVEIALHDLGGNGPPLLLTHATGFCGPVWGPVAGRLRDRFHCWAPDLRGHGRSVAPDGLDFHWDGFADDVLAVVDHLAPDAPLHAVGHSKGGASLLLAEERRPGTFARLYCYEPVVFPPGALAAMAGAGDDEAGATGTGRGNHLAEGALRRRPDFASFDEAYENFASKAPLNVLRSDALQAYVEGGFRKQDDGTVTLRCRPEVESQVYRMGGDHDAFSHLGEVDIPVTIAVGGRYDPGPAFVASAIAGALPNGELVVLDGLGHFGPLEDPDAIADDVLRAFGP